MNKVMKSFALFLSMSLTSNSWVCAAPTICTLLNQAKEKRENLFLKFPGEFNSQVARCFVTILKDFAKNYEYVGIVDPKDVIIPKDAPKNTIGVRLPSYWSEGEFVFDYGQSLSQNLPYYHDRNVLDHTPGFFDFLLLQGHPKLKDMQGFFDELKERVGISRLEALLNCILSLDTPRLNTLVLGACLYVVALESGADAFMVHTNLSGDGIQFDAKNSETSVVISTKHETFMVTFKSNKESSFYLLKQDLLKQNLFDLLVKTSILSSLPPDFKFKKGSILYFTGKVSNLGLEPNWHLPNDMSVSKLQEIIDVYNKEKQKNNGIHPYDGNIPDFMGSYSHLWND